MKNLKKYTISLASIGAIAAPVATVIACGTPKLNRVVSETINPIEVPKEIQNSGMTVPSEVKPYSLKSLRDEAKSIGHEASWTMGPIYHAISSTMSFIDQLAEAFGYSSEKDDQGKTVREKNFADWVVMDDSNHQAIFNALTNPTPTAHLLNGLSRGEPIDASQKLEIALTFGDNSQMADGTLKSLNINWAQIMDYKGGGEFKIKLPDNTIVSAISSTNYSVTQTNVPGQLKVTLFHDIQKIARTIVIDNATPSYPIIENKKLTDDYAPYVKDIFNKFLSMKNNDPAFSFARQVITPELLEKINFLILKNTIKDEKTDKYVFRIDDKVFIEKMQTLNNGSTDWLALKAFYCGFDQTMTGPEILPYTGFANYGLSQKIAGLMEIKSLLEFQGWAHTASFKDVKIDGQLIPESLWLPFGYRQFFYPSKTPVEMDEANGFVRTQGFIDFINHYSSSDAIISANNNKIKDSLGKIQKLAADIVANDPLKIDVVNAKVNKASQISQTITTDIDVSNKSVDDIEAIEGDLRNLLDIVFDQVHAALVKQFTDLDLMAKNKAKFDLAANNWLSVSELKSLFADDFSLPAVPLRDFNDFNSKFFNFKDSSNFFLEITTLEKQFFKIVSYTGEKLTLEVTVGYGDILQFLLGTHKVKIAQFTIKNVTKN